MIDTPSLTLAQADQIISSALAAARVAGFPAMAVVVLDAAGNPVALKREDGASMLRVDIATSKAWAAVGMGVASRVLHQRALDNPPFFNALASSSHGKFIPQTGAVVIKRADGLVIGAVGASGGSGADDEQICSAGVAAAGLVVG